MAQDLIDKIRAQAQARGLDPEIAVRIAQAESSLDPTAKAKTSSAEGLFQVIDKTWKEYGGKPGQKRNPDENIRVGLDILAANQKSLRNTLGREPSASELYAAHFLGAQGAKTLLAASPDTPVDQLLSARAVKANPTLLKDKNAAQLLAALDAKMGGAGSRTTAQAPAPAQAPMPAAAAGAPKRAAGAAPKIAANQLGTGYQAALALSFLADEDEEGPLKDENPYDREERIARESGTSAAQMLAEYKPKNALAQIDWDESSLVPVQRMAAGGVPYVPTASLRPSYRAQLAQMESSSADYNKAAEDYGKEVDKYNAAVEAYNANPKGEFTLQEPTAPAAPNVTQEQYDALAAKAKKDLQGRSLALQVAANPEQFGLSMNKFFAEGGEVQEPSLIAVPGYSEMVARDMYPGQQGQFDQQDAARHMLAAGTLARKYGPGTAEFLGKAHEIVTSPARWIGSKLGISQMPVDYEQDLHNNQLGIELARRSKSQKDLEDLVQAEAERAAREKSAGRAWVGRPERPVKRAEGSPASGEVAEPTAEELAAASRPAFVAQKSGIGRKISTKPGEIEAAMVQGVSEMPYNLVGAPVDIATMALRPFGYRDQAPVMGSEWIKQQMTRLGVRPEPPTQPTQRAFYEAGQLGSSLINPAAPVRAAATAAERVAPVVERAVAAAAPAARSTAAQMLEKVQDVPVGMSIKPVEPIFRHMPSAEAPFVGRLDEFVATLQSPVRKEQFLGQLKGKFREQDIARAEGALQDLPANAKLTPSDLLNRLKSRYDPANMRTTVLEPRDKAYFSAQDNPYSDKPVGVIHLSSYAEPALLERIKKAESLNLEFSNLRSLEYGTEAARFPKITQVVQQDPQAAQKLAEVIRMREQAQEHLRPLLEGRLLMQELDYPILAPNFNQRQSQLRETYRAAGHPDPYGAAMNATKESIKRGAEQALAQMFGRVPKNRDDLQYLLSMRMGGRYDDWAKQGEILEQGTKQAADELRTFLLSDPQRFGMEAPYKGKSVHGSLNPPPNAAAFTRFVEQTVRDPDRGPLKGIHLLEIQSDLTSELKAGKNASLKEKEVFPNMAENRRLVQQLGMKNAIAAAINRGDQFVTFPGAESAKPKLYESLKDNLKAVAKDLGPGFEIRRFTFTSARDNKEMKHLGITWGPEAAQQIQQRGVPFKDGGMVERNPADSRKYL